MERQELEKEVFKRLRITRAYDIRIARKAIKLKPTTELEDILKRMKESGR